jgi:hypothetical protein
VRVYTPENPVGIILTEDDTLSAEPVISGWSMPITKLFEESED